MFNSFDFIYVHIYRLIQGLPGDSLPKYLTEKLFTGTLNKNKKKKIFQNINCLTQYVTIYLLSFTSHTMKTQYSDLNVIYTLTKSPNWNLTYTVFKLTQKGLQFIFAHLIFFLVQICSVNGACAIVLTLFFIHTCF